MRGFQSSSFDPQTLVILETAFDEAWLTLKAVGNTTVRPDGLGRSGLRLGREGEGAGGREADRPPPIGGCLNQLLRSASDRQSDHCQGLRPRIDHMPSPGRM